MKFVKKAKMATLTTLSILALVMPVDGALAKGGKDHKEETTTSKSIVKPMMSEIYQWSADFEVLSYFKIKKTLVLDYRERGLKVEANATTTGLWDSYEVHVEEFDEDTGDWFVVDTVDLSDGRDTAYFADLEQATKYRISIEGSVEGTVWVYKLVD